MKRRLLSSSHLLVAAGLLACISSALAEIAHRNIDAGGGPAKGSTARYQNTATLGGITGPSPATSTVYHARNGYPAELHEPRSFTISAARSSLSFKTRNSGNGDFGLYAGDGIADTWQIEWFGLENPAGLATADSSGTGQSNLFKYRAGLNPLDPADRFTLEIHPAAGAPTGEAGPYTLNFGPCHPGRSYRLLTSGNLSDWTLLHEHHSTQSGQQTYTDPTPTAERKFYKVEPRASFPPIHKIATAGDSITAETSYIVSGDGTNYWPGCWPTHLRTLLNHRIIYQRNPLTNRYTFAVSGARTPIFRPGGSTRHYWEALLESNADTVMIMLGANDIVHQTNNIDETTANIISLWDEILQTNKQVIGLSILPCRSDHPSAAFYPSRQQICNIRLKAAAKDRGIQFIELGQVLDEDGDGFAEAKYLIDTIHPNIEGGMLLADLIASQIAARVDSPPQRSIPPEGDLAWRTPNSHPTPSPAGGTKATGWTIQTAGNASFQSTLIPRTDGIAGHWQELRINGMTEAGIRKSIPSDFIQLYTANFNSNHSIGDKLVMVAEIEMDSPFWSVWTEMYVSVLRAGDHQTNGSLISMQNPPRAYRGVLMTEPWTYTEGSTSLAMLKICGNGTIRIGRLGILRVE